MVKNILLYISVLLPVFVFNIFFYEWFSWFLLVLTLCVPVFSLVISLPFMIANAVKGFAVYTQKEVVVGDELQIRIARRNGKSGFCPLVGIKFKTINQFAKKKKRLEFLYGGILDEYAYKKTSQLTRNCGCLKIKAKYCKVYDMLGIFFIPVKLNFQSEVLIMPKPEKPMVLPDLGCNQIIGYKPKTSGFAEEYELRNYQRGDSLKNIHWKISARYNEPIVKEPSTPVYRPVIIKPVITQKPKENNVTLGKLIYALEYLNKSKAQIYISSSDGKLIEVCDKEDIKKCISGVYQNNIAKQQNSFCEKNVLTYTITHSEEAVSE